MHLDFNVFNQGGRKHCSTLALLRGTRPRGRHKGGGGGQEGRKRGRKEEKRRRVKKGEREGGRKVGVVLGF